MVKSSPLGLRWRSHAVFILSTVAIGQFTDLFLYGMMIPVLPFLLRDRLDLPRQAIQSNVSQLLAAFSAASLVFSVPAGWLADWTSNRQAPYLLGLLFLMAATITLTFAESFLVLFLSRALQGLSAAVVYATGLAMVTDTVGPNSLGRTLGTIHSFVAVGELAAPPLGGFLYDRSGYGGVLGISIAALVVDLLMRLLLIEKKAAAVYQSLRQNKHGMPYESNGIQEGTVQTQRQTSTDEATECDRLLPANEYDLMNGNNIAPALPIFSCLSNRRLLVSLALGLVQALIIGTYDATLTTEAVAEFEFSSSETGALFLALGLPNLFLAPLAGWAVDKYGTKVMAVVGFGLFAPCLAILRIPGECHNLNRQQSIGLFCAILVLNGVCMSMVSAPGIVEASAVVRLFDKANPGFFGPNGPYGQLFGLTTFVFNAGLTVGSMWSGPLRDSIGYGNMYGLVAGLAVVAAALSFKYFGAKDKS